MGERVPRPRLSDDTREAIRASYRRTRSPLSVAEAFGVSRSTVHRVLDGFDAARIGAVGAAERRRVDGTVVKRRTRWEARGEASESKRKPLVRAPAPRATAAPLPGIGGATRGRCACGHVVGTTPDVWQELVGGHLRAFCGGCSPRRP
jgi:hypothetical protein